MPVTVVCVGKLRERFFADAAAEYLKRLRRLMPVTVVEVPDEPAPSSPARCKTKQCCAARRKRILAPFGPGPCHRPVRGRRQYESPELAARLDSLFTQGKSHIAFVIGGSLGLHPSVLKRADERMSMSRMTFPHQLARVMLLEQLFRAAKINAGAVSQVATHPASAAAGPRSPREPVAQR